MNKKIIWGVVVVIIVIAGVAGFMNKKATVPVQENAMATNVTIMVPDDVTAYSKAIDNYVFNGGPDVSKTWPFVKKTVSISPTSDVVKASAEAAALVIPSQGGPLGASIIYLKIVNGTAYVLLEMDIDGWAGVSAATSKIHPLIERTLLQFPEITAVKFGPAPGDSIDSIQKANIDSQSNPVTATPASNWKTYSDISRSFSFSYPSSLSVNQKYGEVVLDHSISFKHPNPCDFKGDAPPLERLTDFKVSLEVINLNLKDIVQSTDYPGWDYVSKNPYALGSLSGYRIDSGVEGCGEKIYYFTLSPTKTLVIHRPYVTELSGAVSDTAIYLKLPGVITPSQEEEYFTKIITSFKFTN